MANFVLYACLMTLVAAMIVGLPLLRERRGRWAGVFASIFVMAAAGLLYPLWSTWDWQAATRTSASPDILAMVNRLDRRLRTSPGDCAGWMMLGRSYVILKRLDDGVAAYGHARQCDPTSADAAIGLGEALSLRADNTITPEAAAAFEFALKAAPRNPMALLYGGFSALSHDDPIEARRRWLALKALHPDVAIEAEIDSRLAELPINPTAPTLSRVADRGNLDNKENAATTNLANVVVRVDIAPGLRSRLKGTEVLFVFAREPGVQGPPLAAKRMTSAALGSSITLSASDSMLPGQQLSYGKRILLTARVSFDGQPLPAAGDLAGELMYVVGQDGERKLLIDKVID